MPDGTRLLPPGHYDELAASLGADELTARGVLRVHPAFRVLATAEPPAGAEAAGGGGGAGCARGGAGGSQPRLSRVVAESRYPVALLGAPLPLPRLARAAADRR